ncbi:MAG: cell division protein FtsZ [Flavobacterium sp.]
MTSNSDFGSISFDLPKNQSNVIKVIGVGGGGSNAINHMFKQGIKGVDFIVCNTDSQALQSSAVPNKIQLGVNLTEGLGAGANPEIGHQSAIESVSEIEKMLDSNTKMVFITAGMGGGTGTGAAPVIAQLAKEKDILTVGIVTIPFQFEGKVRQEQALIGVEKLRKQVDSLIVINNNKLREVYGNLGFKAGYSKSDEVLATASRGIAEVITHHYLQNIDLRDAKTVLANSGTAIMGSAVCQGENRAKEAIVSALDSPLLNDNKITGAKNVLLLIVSGTDEITIDEISEINEHIQNEAGHGANIIMGVGEDESLGNAIAVTIIATGFNVEQQNEIVTNEPKKIIHPLEEEQKLTHDLTPKTVVGFDLSTDAPLVKNDEKIVHALFEEEPVVQNPEIIAQTVVETPVVSEPVFVEPVVTEPVFAASAPVIEKQTFEFDLIPTSELIKNMDVTFEIVSPVANDFVVTTPEIREIRVKEPEFVIENKEQITFSFDAPVAKTEPVIEKTPIFESNVEVNQIKVNDAVEVISEPNDSANGKIVHSLEVFMDDYLEMEKELLNSKPVANKVVEEPVNPEMNITVKRVEEPIAFKSETEVNPTEMPIDDVLRMRAEERRRKMKEFNYKFSGNSRIEEMEKEPAYRRFGIDLNAAPETNNKSRMSLGIDSNDDIQLRSNNSFLHDNVD